MKNLILQDQSSINIEDIIYNQLYDQWYQYDECRNEALCSYNFYEGGNFFDIGAFNGVYSYILSPKGDGSHFVSFEPDSRFTDTIAACLNNLKQNTPYIKYILSTTPAGNGETVQFNLPNRGPNGEVGHPCFFGHNTENQETGDNSIKSITIDNFVKETNIIPSLIKIDVEGAELNVLNGARDILSQYKPKIILELHESYLKNNFNIDPQEVFTYLNSFSYKENTEVKNDKVKNNDIKVLYFE